MPYSGFGGYVGIVKDSTFQVLGKLSRWTISVSQDTIDVSHFDPEAGPVERRFRKFLPGPLGWTATAEGFVEPGDPGQMALKTAIENAEVLTFYFFIESGKYLYGRGILSSEDFELAWDSAGTVSYDITGTEMLTKVGWE